MSRRLMARFLKERLLGRKLFVPFITAGDRGLGFTERAVLKLAQAGADAIELGIPFSDPLADGPVIQRSSQRALAQGTTLPQVLDLVAHLRTRTQVPLLFMGYLNPFLQFGLKRLTQAAGQAGLDGFIVPDLPPEEAQDWIRACRAEALDTIFLSAPTSTLDRLQAVAQASTGFIYYISVTGTTGARKTLSLDLEKGVERLRKLSSLPVLVGFGISTPQQAQAAALAGDGVIVGSALVKAMATGSPRSALERLGHLAAQLAKAVKKS